MSIGGRLRRSLLKPADDGLRWTMAGVCIGGATALAFARAAYSTIRYADPAAPKGGWS